MNNDYDNDPNGKVLYDLLFNKKVEKLGSLDVKQHIDYVVIGFGNNEEEDNGTTKKSD